jgi:hypothetical protein
MRDDSHGVVVVMQQPVCCHQSSGRTVFAHLNAVAEIDCLACKDKFFVNNSLHVKEHMEYALDFAPQLSRLFRSALN